MGAMKPAEEFENLKSVQLYADSLSTVFVIWVRHNVKPHYHARHTESIYVLEGEGTMFLDEEMIGLKPGIFVFIPKGSIHWVEVNSSGPMKVISVQSPMFDGSDRILVD